MNYCTNNFRYRKLEKDIFVIKNKELITSNQLNHQQVKNHTNNSGENTYTGKNYSSIKSLIRRLEASGNTKINYPRIRTRNERADIFLQGGSINQIKKINFLEEAKDNTKNPLLKRRKTQTKFDAYPTSIEDYQSQMDQVFIRKRKRSQEQKQQKQQIHKKSTTVKTQIQKSIPLNHISKTFSKKQGKQLSVLQNFEVKNQEKNNFQTKIIVKLQDPQLKRNLKTSEQVGDSKLQKRNISTRQTVHMQVAASQTSMQNHLKHIKRVNVSRSIVNSNIQIKTTPNKRQVSMPDINKPLFYITQEDLRQLRLTAKNFIVMEYPSKQIITGSYYKQVAQIASLTKIITFYCCLLIIEKYNLDIDKQLLTIDQQVQCTSGTSAQLLEGDQYTFRQICFGLMLPSGNDAALAMAKWGGRIIESYQSQTNLKTFMSFMNTTCNQIGMKSSFFGNPHGLPHPKSGSTVEDVSIVIYEALRFPFFRQVIKTKVFRCWIQNNGLKREVVWQNTNKLLRRNGFIGVKTGVTVTAGPCLSTCYQVDDKVFIIVLLKTTKLSRRFKQTRRILGKVLGKLDWNCYKLRIKQILKNDAQLDSDNSQDQQQFNYERNDNQQMKKRLKIITYQM